MGFDSYVYDDNDVIDVELELLNADYTNVTLLLAKPKMTMPASMPMIKPDVKLNVPMSITSTTAPVTRSAKRKLATTSTPGTIKMKAETCDEWTPSKEDLLEAELSDDYEDEDDDEDENHEIKRSVVRVCFL